MDKLAANWRLTSDELSFALANNRPRLEFSSWNPPAFKRSARARAETRRDDQCCCWRPKVTKTTHHYKRVVCESLTATVWPTTTRLDLRLRLSLVLSLKCPSWPNWGAKLILSLGKVRAPEGRNEAEENMGELSCESIWIGCRSSLAGQSSLANDELGERARATPRITFGGENSWPPGQLAHASARAHRFFFRQAALIWYYYCTGRNEY